MIRDRFRDNPKMSIELHPSDEDDSDDEGPNFKDVFAKNAKGPFIYDVHPQ